MQKNTHRIDRIGDVFHRIIAETLYKKFNDPRIGSVTIKQVMVSKDLSYAKVFVTVLEEDKIATTLAVLNKASGFFRTQVAQSVQLRKTPQFKFIFDDSVLKGNRISKLIDSVIQPPFV